MSVVIWKYQLDVRQNQLVMMPEDATVLSVTVQNDFPVVYILTTGKEARLEERIFSVVTTGERFEPLPRPLLFDSGFYGYGGDASRRVHKGNYLGTVTLGQHGGWYVAHVFSDYVNVSGDKLEDRRQLQHEHRNSASLPNSARLEA